MNAPAPKELPPLCPQCGKALTDDLEVFCSSGCAIDLAYQAARLGWRSTAYQVADRRRRLRGDDK